MEGLEAVEVKFSDVVEDNLEFRIDADFFRKEFINIFSLLKKTPHDRLINKVSELKSFGAYSLTNQVNFVAKGIPFIRCLNIKNGITNFEDVLFIDQLSNELLWKSEIKPDTVLVTMSGTVGNSTVALPSWQYPINSNQDIAKISTQGLNPYFLSVFLSTKAGALQMQRLQAGAIQQHLYLSQIEKIIIPETSNVFQNQVEMVFLKAHKTLDDSQSLYTTAETLLLTELGFTGENSIESLTKPAPVNSNEKGFKESFLATGRLDAEYYQEKYERVIHQIKESTFDLLGQLTSIKKSIEPGSEAYKESGIPFVRVSNLTKFGLSEPDIHLDRSVYGSFDIKPKKDTILLSKDGSVGIAYKVETDLDVITSSALLHLTIASTKILPDCLALILNSPLTQLQAERDAGGSIIQHWRPEEIKQVLIPILPMEIQRQIANKIQESFSLRKQSKALLDLAKKAVEVAIEEGEERGMEILKSLNYA